MIILKKNSGLKKIKFEGLVVQWLRLCAFSAEGAVSILGWETKIPLALRCGKEKKKIKNHLSL